MIERLSFDRSVRYNATEAASHLNRYLLAKPLCRGCRVLDVACGEGYGAFLMARHWGAAAVEAVDISAAAIARARELFSDERVHFHCRPAEALDELFEPGQFDLIVSLETIEHVADAAAFLANLRRRLRPGGAVVLSCPNDYWYYPAPAEHNPFHVRKFTLAEFRGLAEAAFGSPRALFLGTPLAGFVNLPLDSAELAFGGGEHDMTALLTAGPPPPALLLPGEEEVTERNCSYFAGIWTPAPDVATTGCGVLFPCSMTASTHASQAANVENLRAEVTHLRTSLFEAEQALHQALDRAPRAEEARAAAEAALHELQAASADRLTEHARAVRHLELRLAALRAENEYVREEAFRARRHADWLEAQRSSTQARVDELEAFIGSLRQTIADQAVLVDERDAYIRELEQRLEHQRATHTAALRNGTAPGLLQRARRMVKSWLGRGG